MLQCTIALSGLRGDPRVPVTQSTCQNRMVLYSAVLGYQGTARMACLPRAMRMAVSKKLRHTVSSVKRQDSSLRYCLEQHQDGSERRIQNPVNAERERKMGRGHKLFKEPGIKR